MNLQSFVLRCILLGALPSLPSGTTIIAAAQFPAENPHEACSKSHLKSITEIDGYVFRNYANKDDGTACVQVVHEGKVIFRRTNDNDGWFQIGQPANKRDKVPAIPNGTDITGRGHPDMIVAAFSGGAHCCLSHYVFELEPQFKLLAHLDAEDTWPAYFDDLDHDGHYYYIAEDWTFAYWLGSFAGSPNHQVILRWQDSDNGGAFHLAMDKMRRPPPTKQEWEDALGQVRGLLDPLTYGFDVPLWNEVMDLIYTGHPDLAWKFLDELPRIATHRPAGPDLEEFCITLKESPYWPDLEPTMKEMPPDCAKAKPGRKD